MKTPPTPRPPITEARIREDLVAIGVAREMTLIVHASLSAIGWVVGGAPAVVRALLQVLGPQGTLAMPAATPHCADPATWSRLPVSEAELETRRSQLPIFDRETTPTAMGAIAESFRTWPGTLRSDHPLESVCARGPMASRITCDHRLEFSEGEGTPFGRLHDLDSTILLLGVGFNRCTALHFAESLVARRRTMTVRFPMLEDGRRIWREVTNVADDNDTHFPRVGDRYRSAGQVREASIGEARSILFPMRDLVAFALTYFEEVL